MVLVLLVNGALVAALIFMARRIGVIFKKRESRTERTLVAVRVLAILIGWMILFSVFALYMLYVGRGQSLLFVSTEILAYLYCPIEIWHIGRLK